MRHLGSLALSLVGAAATYVLLAIASTRWADSDSGDNRRSVIIALIAAGLAGLVYSGLVLLRISPIGPVIAGLALAGLGLWSTLASGSFDGRVPEELFNQPVRFAGPVSLMLAVPLLMTIFSPRRWRRWPDGRESFSPEPNYYAPPEPSPFDQPLGYTSTTPPPFGAPEPTWPGDPYATDNQETTTRRM